MLASQESVLLLVARLTNGLRPMCGSVHEKSAFIVCCTFGMRTFDFKALLLISSKQALTPSKVAWDVKCQLLLFYE